MTPRELEVLEAIRRGARSLSSIARALDPPVSPRTAEAHVTAIARKLPTDYEPTAGILMRVILWTVERGSGIPE